MMEEMTDKLKVSGFILFIRLLAYNTMYKRIGKCESLYLPSGDTRIPRCISRDQIAKKTAYLQTRYPI